ncbi:MAG: M23 family metallopeptidase [Prevotella sp.]|nr:M23 family metallopeptidase [Prevotella sp.]
MNILNKALLLTFLACAVARVAVAQAPHDFTPAERQSISVETPGLFERSDAFSIDFTAVREHEYSFPLPVGKAEVVNHSNLIITTTKGDAVKAMFDGTVRLSKHIPPFGNVIVIRHGNGLETVYGANAQNLVKVGDKVKAGQTIAIVGGEDMRVFCDFAIMVNGRRINPATIIEPNSHRLRRQMVMVKKMDNEIEVKTTRPERNRPVMLEDPFQHGDSFKWNLAQMPTSEWAYPLPECKVISPYGNRRGRRAHSGVDLKTVPNDEIHAAFDGEVIQSGPYSGYGNCIKIKHGNGLTTLYSHQSKNLVKVGQQVKAGEIIGLTGRTGRATTEHLHFEIFFQGHRHNPNIIFDHANHKLQNATLTIRKNGSVTSKKN